MGVLGWATLEEVDDEIAIQPGPGAVVTGTFAHISDAVIDLQIEGQPKPIGCTTTHPFWSVDRQDFVEAGQLQQGERVQLYSGETKRVVQKLPRPGPVNVYNLEVYAEHVYSVTQDGVLAHNSCNKNKVYVAIVDANGDFIDEDTFKNLIQKTDEIPQDLWVEYVGITNDVNRRSREHKLKTAKTTEAGRTKKPRIIHELHFDGHDTFTRDHARAIEQLLINRYRKSQNQTDKLLSNKIDSVNAIKFQTEKRWKDAQDYVTPILNTIIDKLPAPK